MQGPRLSVVIPALNEERRLPVLLDCLAAQTVAPDEILIADAGSSDRTVELARARGAKVVAGGLPAVARNAGARAANGDLLLFLDADVEFGPDFLRLALAEFQRRGLRACSATLRPVERDWRWEVSLWISGTVERLLERLAPHGNGACLLVSREIHEAIGGFDETLPLAEDHDYARRASQVGAYGLLHGVQVRTSMRRLERTSALKMAFMIVYAEVHVIAGLPIRKLPFEYDYRHDELLPSGTRGGAIRGLLRRLRKPSTELHGDALGAFVGLMLCALALLWFLHVRGIDERGLVFLAIPGLLALPAAYVLARKARYERAYGNFLSTSVFVADHSLRDSAGRHIVRAGVDELAELHVIRGQRRMAQLNRQPSGRARMLLECLEGLQVFSRDLDHPLYSRVTHVCARSDISLVGVLLRLGFEEVPDPPAFDLVNRLEKRLLMTFLNRRLGISRPKHTAGYRMVVLSRDRFASEEFGVRLADAVSPLEQQLERVVGGP